MQVVERFREDDDFRVCQFPPDLGSNERKYVHEVARKVGLVSKSSGKGDQRFLTLRRKPGDLNIPVTQCLRAPAPRFAAAPCRPSSRTDTDMRTGSEIASRRVRGDWW